MKQLLSGSLLFFPGCLLQLWLVLQVPPPEININPGSLWHYLPNSSYQAPAQAHWLHSIGIFTESPPHIWNINIIYHIQAHSLQHLHSHSYSMADAHIKNQHNSTNPLDITCLIHTTRLQLRLTDYTPLGYLRNYVCIRISCRPIDKKRWNPSNPQQQQHPNPFFPCCLMQLWF